MTNEVRCIAVWTVVAVIASVAGCARLKTTPCAATASAGSAMTCDVPGYTDRSYDLAVPTAYDGTAAPVLLVLHGGGGSRFGALKVTCPAADIDSPSCLHARALARGFLVVAPDGTAGKVGNFRTWNAGGGGDRYRCTSGLACEQNVDDVSYVRALLDDVGGRVNVDSGRVFVTGLSNGGAMSHRLACELADRVAAVAPVGGAMQLTVNADCTPARPVPVLQIHGTDDPCWLYEGGVPTCSDLVGQPGKEHVSVESTMDHWARINGCGGEPQEASLEDTQTDGTQTARVTWPGCGADTELLRIEGGGHTWPQGDQYLGESTIGRVPQDWGNDLILDWLEAHPMPGS